MPEGPEAGSTPPEEAGAAALAPNSADSAADSLPPKAHDGYMLPPEEAHLGNSAPPGEAPPVRSHLSLLLVVVGIMGITGTLPWVYAPLYRHVCGVLGIPVAPQQPTEVLMRTVREGIGRERHEEGRSLVNFMGVSGQLPIDIRPLERRAWIKTGDAYGVVYRLTNLTKKQLDYRAVHMVMPANESFQLIKCFCDEHRIIKPGEVQDLPLAFRLTKQVPGDAGLTVNYTIFDYAPEQNRAATETVALPTLRLGALAQP